jgi:hypothetical protein
MYAGGRRLGYAKHQSGADFSQSASLTNQSKRRTGRATLAAYGGKDGKIVIENESQKIMAGSRKVVGDVHSALRRIEKQ